MAAYAAMVSLMHIIDKLELHPRPPISLHKKQVHLLTAKLNFLQEFLQGYNPRLSYSAEVDPLEIRITDAAYAAEDAIESHVVDRIKNSGEKISSDGLYEALEKLIEELASIEKDAMEIEGSVLHRNSTHSDSSRSSSIAHKSSMVGVDDVLLEMNDKLTSHCRDLQILPIVGMGGTGKTTLARNIYQQRLVKEHFDVCAWATISQDYSIREILREVVGEQIKEGSHHLIEDELGEILHKHLFGRRYLMIMDDMWSIEAWDGVKRFLPDNKNGSRVVITTRLSNLAANLASSRSLEMSLLDDGDSWDLLSKTVFGEEKVECPLELGEIGKKIAKSCRGLPLSIVVVGGLLAKSKHTREFWEYIEENLNAIVNLDDDERCLKILHLSYKQLPVHLKPCFLYMGVFPEDEVIHVSRVVKLWVAEGFLKPVTGKCSEEIAKECLKELVDRNLVLIHKMGSIGGIKHCKIHDLLRDFCLRESRKERFYTVVARPPSPQGFTNARRCAVIPSTSKEEAIHTLQSMSQARSLIWGLKKELPSLNSRLLRVFQSTNSFPHLQNMLQLVNLRHVADMSLDEEKFLSSRLWNLETLIVKGLSEFALPAEIWCMPQLRHVEFEEVHLPDPPPGCPDDIVLGNLHTLQKIRNFKCSEEVVKRIPDIRKLGIVYSELDGRLCCDNLVTLHKLESLNCSFTLAKNQSSLQSLNFPLSLKKLSLEMTSQSWQDVLEKIGSLPLLEKLKLNYGHFQECQWESVEGQFRRLKYLEIARSNLEQWTMESSHFPCLEQLVLRRLYWLEEIPLDVAEIPTLRLIYFVFCRTCAITSAKRIVEKQEELHGEVAIQILLRLKVAALHSEEAKECSASPNIRFE